MTPAEATWPAGMHNWVHNIKDQPDAEIEALRAAIEAETARRQEAADKAAREVECLLGPTPRPYVATEGDEAFPKAPVLAITRVGSAVDVNGAWFRSLVSRLPDDVRAACRAVAGVTP